MKPVYKMPSINEPRGNIFCIMGEVCTLISEEQGTEMTERVQKAKSYEEAKQIIGEYVDVV